MDKPLTWTNRDAIAKFNRKRGVPKNGSQLILPDIGQVHTVIGVKFWRYANRFPRTQVSLVMESSCAVCGARYDQHLGWRFRHGLIRTCEAHRRQWRTPVPWTQPNKPARFRERVAALLLAELSSATVENGVSTVSVENTVRSLAQCIPVSLVAKEDRRRRHVRNALRQLIERNALPKGIRVSETHFFLDHTS